MHKDLADLSTIADYLVINTIFYLIIYKINKSHLEWEKLDDAIDDITCLIIQLRD